MTKSVPGNLNSAFESLVATFGLKDQAVVDATLETVDRKLSIAIRSFEAELQSPAFALSPTAVIKSFQDKIIPALKEQRLSAFAKLEQKHSEVSGLATKDPVELTQQSFNEFGEQVEYVSSLPSIELLEEQIKTLRTLSEGLDSVTPATARGGGDGSLSTTAILAFDAIKQDLKASFAFVQRSDRSTSAQPPAIRDETIAQVKKKMVGDLDGNKEVAAQKSRDLVQKQKDLAQKQKADSTLWKKFARFVTGGLAYPAQDTTKDLAAITTDTAAIKMLNGEVSKIASAQKSIESQMVKQKESAKKPSPFTQVAAQAQEFVKQLATDPKIIKAFEAKAKSVAKVKETRGAMQESLATALNKKLMTASLISEGELKAHKTKAAKVIGFVGAASDAIPVIGTGVKVVAFIAGFIEKRREKAANDKTAKVYEKSSKSSLEAIVAKLADIYCTNEKLTDLKPEAIEQMADQMVKKIVGGIRSGALVIDDGMSDDAIAKVFADHVLQTKSSSMKIGPKKELKMEESEKDRSTKYTAQGAANRQGILLTTADGSVVTLTTKDRQANDEEVGRLKYGARAATAEEQKAYNKDGLTSKAFKDYAQFVPLQERLQQELDGKLDGLKRENIKGALGNGEVKSAIDKIVERHQERLAAKDKNADVLLKGELKEVLELGSRSSILNKEDAIRATFNEVKGLIHDLASNKNFLKNNAQENEERQGRASLKEGRSHVEVGPHTAKAIKQENAAATTPSQGMVAGG